MNILHILDIHYEPGRGSGGDVVCGKPNKTGCEFTSPQPRKSLKVHSNGAQKRISTPGDS